MSESIEELANRRLAELIKEAEEKQILCTLKMPKETCDHDFEVDDQGCVEYHGQCLKCGMSFIRHIHMECP
jgi:hypothetical protein